MSSFMYGRYCAIEEKAADAGGTPAVGARAADDADQAIMEAGTDKPVTFNYAGWAGEKVLALIPAEALAVYTLATDPDHLGDLPGLNLSLRQLFWFLPLVASALYIGGRVSLKTYARLFRIWTNANYKIGTRVNYAIGEILRVLAPFIAMISWLLMGETIVAQSGPVRSWGWLDWARDQSTVTMSGWGMIFLVVALAITYIADKIGFKEKT